jgi:hypothetical protein
VIGNRPLWVTIPTIGYSELLIPLVNALEQDRSIDKILLTVNLESHVEPVQDFFRFGEPTIEVVETWPMGRSIHHGWNTSIERARKEDAWLAVLNDDIRLLEPNAISTVAGLLASHPSHAIVGLNWQESPESTSPGARPLRQVHGSYRHHGVGGFAWVCDSHKVRTVPETLVWWGGDDACFFYAEEDGYKLGVASHVHVEHANELTANANDQNWTHESKNHDWIEFNRLFPGKAW